MKNNLTSDDAANEPVQAVQLNIVNLILMLKRYLSFYTDTNIILFSILYLTKGAKALKYQIWSKTNDYMNFA